MLFCPSKFTNNTPIIINISPKITYIFGIWLNLKKLIKDVNIIHKPANDA